MRAVWEVRGHDVIPGFVEDVASRPSPYHDDNEASEHQQLQQTKSRSRERGRADEAGLCGARERRAVDPAAEEGRGVRLRARGRGRLRHDGPVVRSAAGTCGSGRAPTRAPVILARTCPAAWCVLRASDPRAVRGLACSACAIPSGCALPVPRQRETTPCAGDVLRHVRAQPACACVCDHVVLRMLAHIGRSSRGAPGIAARPPRSAARPCSPAGPAGHDCSARGSTPTRRAAPAARAVSRVLALGGCKRPWTACSSNAAVVLTMNTVRFAGAPAVGTLRMCSWPVQRMA